MSLTNQQLITLKTAILAETNPTFVTYRTNGQTPLMAAFFNSDSSFVVYRSQVSASEVGLAFDAAALDVMTAGNAEKLANFRAWNDTVIPTRADHRAFFSGIFSVSSGATTRTALDTLWRRFASRCERLFATGTGTTVAPGYLVFEGQITDSDISAALVN